MTSGEWEPPSTGIGREESPPGPAGYRQAVWAVCPSCRGKGEPSRADGPAVCLPACRLGLSLNNAGRSSGPYCWGVPCRGVRAETTAEARLHDRAARLARLTPLARHTAALPHCCTCYIATLLALLRCLKLLLCYAVENCVKSCYTLLGRMKLLLCYTALSLRCQLAMAPQ